MAARRPNPFLRAGLPMLGLTIGGFLGLRFFLQGRLDVQVGRAAQKGGRAGLRRDTVVGARLASCPGQFAGTALLQERACKHPHCLLPLHYALPWDVQLKSLHPRGFAALLPYGPVSLCAANRPSTSSALPPLCYAVPQDAQRKELGLRPSQPSMQHTDLSLCCALIPQLCRTRSARSWTCGRR